jgi:aryl-alcohol dehydrogenase-like predicted oxidoreductase
VALAAVLAQPWVDLVLSGASTAAMLRSNLVALDLKLEPAVIERFRELALAPEQYWESRSTLHWN